jgi:hypothetical protein
MGEAGSEERYGVTGGFVGLIGAVQTEKPPLGSPAESRCPLLATRFAEGLLSGMIPKSASGAFLPLGAAVTAA